MPVSLEKVCSSIYFLIYSLSSVTFSGFTAKLSAEPTQFVVFWGTLGLSCTRRILRNSTPSILHDSAHLRAITHVAPSVLVSVSSMPKQSFSYLGEMIRTRFVRAPPMLRSSSVGYSERRTPEACG